MDKWITDQLQSQGIKELTTVQKAAIENKVDAGQSLVICSPTSSGKTLVGEIALLAGIRDECKTLYLVSHKALADQKFEEFTKKYGARSAAPITRVAIQTGDRNEGDADAQVIVATYEKALSLVVGDELDMSKTIVVADELQIIGEDKRGPEIEILSAALKRKKPRQIVALTATIQNAEDLAGWLECVLVRVSTRDVVLMQEVWVDKGLYKVKFGDEEFNFGEGARPQNTLDAVEYLLKEKLGPILVFVETRRDAMQLAEEYSRRCAKTPTGYNFSEQLSLFCEGTEFSDRLRSTAEAKVVFHTADLTASERAVIEDGLATSNFDVCFATPTLAAGVNFPFRTVLFDRIKRRYIPPPLLPVGAYRNMSGRAGRLGMHDIGYAVLIPRDAEETKYAHALVMPENETLFSKLALISVRKLVLSLIAVHLVGGKQAIREFLEQTLFWYQVRDRNPAKLDLLVAHVDEAVVWLVENGMLTINGDLISPTELGTAAAKTGLLPSTAAKLAGLLKENSTKLQVNFEEYELPLIHAACCSDEFDQTIGQRLLPPLNPNAPSDEVFAALRTTPLFSDFSDASKAINHTAYAIFLFISGEIERRIAARTGIPSGYVHRFADEIAWILDGLHRIAGVSSIGCPQNVMNKIAILAKRCRTGSPAEIVDLIKTAQSAKVPGFGRQSALALLKAKLSDRESILTAGRDLLKTLLGRQERVDKLVEAIEKLTNNHFDRSKRQHLERAAKLGLDNLVKDSYELNGDAYEGPIEALLKLVEDWKITKLDDGKRQGVPDFLIQAGDRALVLECKTTIKRPPVISKDEAFAVLTKATNIQDVHRVTLGKPGFDTFSENKACGSAEITLVNHPAFVESMLRVLTKEVTSAEVFSWLLEPGVAEIERLPGK